MESCVFCKIVKRQIPSSTVCSDEKTLAFMDIQPVNDGHVLVIPKTHAERLSGLDADTACQMFKAALKLSDALRKSGLKCEGINLFLADGEVAGQEVPHVHLHIIPRFEGDSFKMSFGHHYGRHPDREELEATAEKIRKQL